MGTIRMLVMDGLAQNGTNGSDTDQGGYKGDMKEAGSKVSVIRKWLVMTSVGISIEETTPIACVPPESEQSGMVIA